MSEKPSNFEGFPEIKLLLSVLQSDVQTVLGKEFIGLYIYGSLASGDFNPQRSDIDFLVVTVAALPQHFVAELNYMHHNIYCSGLAWATKLEGSYIPQRALRYYDPAQAHHPSLRVDGTFDIDHHGEDWIIISYLIRKEALVLSGPNPEELIDPISSEALKQAAVGTLEEWWSPQIERPTRLQTDEYRAYSVLTMCRILYTLQHGSVVPKSTAAQWALEFLDPSWTALITAAVAWPEESESNTLLSTQGFIKYAVQRANLEIKL